MLRTAGLGANSPQSSPRPKTLTPAPLPPPPHPPHRERGLGWSGLACLPLLPVWGVRRGREKRAGVMRVWGGGALLLLALLLTVPALAADSAIDSARLAGLAARSIGPAG